MGKNITLSQGHGGADAGSKGADGQWERDRIRDLAPDLKKKLADYGHTITIRSEKNGGGNWAFSTASGDLMISLHFNAFNKSATGTEVLYKKSSMKNRAASMSKKVAKAMGVPNRGAKYRGDLYVMNIGADLLVEVCFHDNKSDLAAYEKNKDKVVSAIAEAIVDMTEVKTASQSKGDGKLDVDGWWGKDCTRKSQKVMKTAIDGIVSNQPTGYKKHLPNADTGSWEFSSSFVGGSPLIKGIQKLIQVKADGWCGKQTVTALQKFLDKKELYRGKVNGIMDADTVKAWQKYINSKL